MDTPNGQQVAEPKLTREELLEIENHVLRIANIKLQGDKLQADMITANTMLKEAQAALSAFRDALKKKYGIDVANVGLQKDGSFTRGS